MVMFTSVSGTAKALALMTFCVSMHAGTAAAGGSAWYSVPVQAELRPYAVNELTEFSWKIVDDVPTLTYRLPVEIANESTSVIGLTGTTGSTAGGFTEMTGPLGAGVCNWSDVAVSCMIRYGNLALQENEIDEFLRSHYGQNAIELEKRQKVAHIFFHDPVGIISISLNGE